MAKNSSYFETDRLIFLKPQSGQLETISSWIQNPEIMKYQGGVWEGKRKHDFFKFLDWHWTKFNFGHFIGLSKNDHTPIGLWSLKYLSKNADLKKDIPDLGFFLSRDYWGQGMATEGAMGLTKYGFDNLGFKEIGALNYPENTASSKVLEKVGFREDGEIEVVYYGQSFGTATKWKLAPNSLLTKTVS